MKNLNCLDLDYLSRHECDKILFELVKHLKHCECASGQEGIAYFINDKLVVKKYKNEKKWDILQDIFEAYCEECQGFSQAGYSVPKIYAWLKIPRKHHIFESRNSVNFDFDSDFYVLEERVPGRELYFRNIESVYELVKNEFSESHFKNVLASPLEHLIDYKEIARTYIKDFIEVNQAIESMPSAELDKFVLSLKNMFDEGVYSVPDVLARNIITDKEHLTIIDNHMGKKANDSYFLNINAERFVATRIMLMFKQNAQHEKLQSKTKKYGLTSEIESLLDDNKIFCAAALKKLYASMKRVFEGKIDKENVSEIILPVMQNLVGEEDVEKIMSTLG